VSFSLLPVSQGHPTENDTASSSKEAFRMRRTIITAVTAIVLAVPGAAIASRQSEHEGPHDQGQHHERHQAGRQRRSHVVTFGTAAASTPTTSTGTTSPAPVGGSSDDTAGTVASFSAGTLAIRLSDGSTVSGKVESFTEIECRAMVAGAARDGQGDDNDQFDDRGHDGGSDSGPRDGRQGADNGRDDNDNGDRAEHCTTAALIPGAVVREAKLRLGAGAVWEKVELDQ
jgi:hypothetical protein